MTLRYGDRVQESVPAPSTSAAFAISTTGGWSNGFQTFANIPGIAANDTVYYSAVDTSGNAEIGIGTYSSGSLARTTILSSSNANAAVTFSGTVTVFCTRPAESINPTPRYPPIPGHWYQSDYSTAGGVIAGPVIAAVPFRLVARATPAHLAVDFSGGAPSPAISLRLGIYTDANGGPDALVANSDTGTLASASGIVSGALTGVGPLPPAWYWLACFESATPSANMNCTAAQTYENDLQIPLGWEGAGRGNPVFGVYATSTPAFGALPAAFGAFAYSTTTNQIPIVYIGF